MQKIEINKKILIFQIQDRDLFTTLPLSVLARSRASTDIFMHKFLHLSTSFDNFWQFLTTHITDHRGGRSLTSPKATETFHFYAAKESDRKPFPALWTPSPPETSSSPSPSSGRSYAPAIFSHPGWGRFLYHEMLYIYIMRQTETEVNKAKQI